MTDIDDEKSPVSRSPLPALPRPLRPYAQIFTVPGAWRFSVAGVIGRMPMAMFGLGTVLLISASTGEYGVAGRGVRDGSLGYAFASPRIARLVDTRGQRQVLLPLLRRVRPGHRGPDRSRGSAPADLDLLPAGSCRGHDHAGAGHPGPGPVERPAGGLTPAAYGLLLRISGR